MLNENLKRVDEQYREKMNKIKTEKKYKIVYTEKIKKHGDVHDQLRMYCCKDREQIEDEVKQSYAKFTQQFMAELTGVLKNKPQAAEICHVCLKSLIIPRIEK